MMNTLLRNPVTTVRRIRRKLLLARDAGRLETFTLAGGIRFTCKLGSSTGRILTQGDIEAVERSFFRERLKPGDVFFDIGANLGLFTLTAAKCVGPEGHVYAFEPSNREADMLEHNIAQNGFRNVTVMRCALSDHVGEARFVVATDGGTNSLAKNTHPEQIVERWEAVPLNTLDAIITQTGVTRVDMMKIDVEGGECDVLRGGEGLFTRADAPVVLSEFCDLTAAGFNSSGSALYEAWEAYGYTMYEIASTTPVRLKRAVKQRHYDYANLVASKQNEFI